MLFAQNFDDVEISIHKISDQIYMLEGAGGNMGLSIGEDGPILIDDQYAPLSEKIKKAISTLTPLEVSFVINTHYHHDHTGGNEEFGELAHIIAHMNTRENVLNYEKHQVKEGKQDEVKNVALPNLTFTNEMMFYHNNQQLRLVYISEAHTDGDILVYFEDENVIHMGDVYVQYGWPYVDMDKGGNVLGMIRVLDYAISMINDKTIVIPGHGSLANRNDMIAFNDMLKIITQRVQSLKQQGKTKEEIIALNPIDGFENVEGNVEAFLGRTYDSLAHD